jgi:hypothetical protein
MMMKIATMMLSASYVTNFSLRISLVKHGFIAQNVEGGAIEFAVETTLLVTARLLSFSNPVDFLNRQKLL